jgi:hypothetical protein
MHDRYSSRLGHQVTQTKMKMHHPEVTMAKVLGLQTKFNHNHITTKYTTGFTY